MQYKLIAILFSLFISSPTIKMGSDSLLAEKTNSKNKSFAMFLSHFKLIEAPMSFNAAELDEYFLNKVKHGKVIPHDLSKKYIHSGRDFKFSRMGPPTLTPVARFYPQENVIGVLYCSQLFPGNSNNYQFILKVYDLNGRELNKEKGHAEAMIVGFKNIETSKSFKLETDGLVWTKDYKNIWADENKKGHPAEKIISYKETDSQAYLINPKGKISELKIYPTEERASLH